MDNKRIQELEDRVRKLEDEVWAIAVFVRIIKEKLGLK